jgi:long-subunit fatty acid transport protein
MPMWNKTVIVFISILLLAASVFAGETEYPLFKLGAGGKAIGMGAASTGNADDASAVFWNPAGLSQIKGTFSIVTSNRLHFQDSKFMELYASYSDIKYGAFGFGFLSNQITDIPNYDGDFNFLGNFDSYQRAFIMGYSYNLAPVNIGLSFTGIQAGMDPVAGDVKGSGLAFSLGLMTRISKNFRIGSVIKPGYSVKYDDSKDEIPGNARLGVEFGLKTGIASPDDSLRLILDLDQSNQLPLKINVGMQVTAFNLLAFRGGLNSLMIETRTENLQGSDLMSANIKYCFGLGIKLPQFEAGSFSLDMGYMSTSLGNSTTLSLCWTK